MRYRQLSPPGDYVFGQGTTEFLVNTPAAVAQAIETRLKLWTGEWFLDQTEGTPYSTLILGRGTTGTYDQAIQSRVLGTQGVQSIDQYVSLLSANRQLSVYMLLSSIYGGLSVAFGPENPYPALPGLLDSSFILNVSLLA